MHFHEGIPTIKHFPAMVFPTGGIVAGQHFGTIGFRMLSVSCEDTHLVVQITIRTRCTLPELSFQTKNLIVRQVIILET